MPFRDYSFINEAESAWSWVTGTEDDDLDTWVYSEDTMNVLTLEHPPPFATERACMSQEANFRAYLGHCLTWARDLAAVNLRALWQVGLSFGASELQ